MRRYDCGLSSGQNFGHQRTVVEASNIREAIEVAEAQYPGYHVHHIDVIPSSTQNGDSIVVNHDQEGEGHAAEGG